MIPDNLIKGVAILLVLATLGIARVDQETAKQPIELSTKRYPLDDTIDEIHKLIEACLKALEPPRGRASSTATRHSADAGSRQRNELRELLSNISGKVDNLIEQSDAYEKQIIRIMEEDRKTLRDLASHGVIDFERGVKKERDVLDKEGDIQNQNANNKLQLINSIRALLLWNSGPTTVNRTDKRSKKPVVKNKPEAGYLNGAEQLRKLLENLKTTLELPKMWVRGIWEKPKG